MINGKDIIIVGLQPWDIAIGSNCKNIALELSRTNRVLYVNRALDRFTAFKNHRDAKTLTRLKSLRGLAPDLQEIATNLWTLDPRVILESTGWIKPPRLFDFFNKLNNRRLAGAINDAAFRLGFVAPILFTDNDFFRAFYLPEMLKQVSFSIYYIRDNLTSQPYFARHGKRLEPLLMAKSSLVVANSAYLADYARRYNPHAADIGQGCDFDNFQRAMEVPPDLASIPHPVIGYVGALITARLDTSILEYIATARPQWQVVLIGPEDEMFRASALHTLPNVHFLGGKPPGQLPDYIAGFDVCINPQAVNDMTMGNYPRKIDEYLAVGKPVVATDTPAMRMFEDYVYNVKDAPGYVKAIESSLVGLNDTAAAARRREFALSHTWENSVIAMGHAFQEITGQSKTMKHGTAGQVQ